MQNFPEQTGPCLSVSPEGRPCIGHDPHFGGHAAWRTSTMVEKWPAESPNNCFFNEKPAFSFRLWDEEQFPITPVLRAARILGKLKCLH